MQLLSLIKQKVNLLLVFLAALPSCTQIGDSAHPIYQLNSWIFPSLTLIGAVIFGYKAHKEKEKFSKNQPVAIYVFGQFWFSFAFTIATIIIVWNLLNNR